jgi:RNA polymerase subunit RPABC4/transcription elongation factor Spt4
MTIYPETGKEALSKLGKKRRNSAQEIARNLEEYKVCETCLSILYLDNALCPLCAGYRFNAHADQLLLIAATCALRDLGLTEPVIPRYKPGAVKKP